MTSPMPIVVGVGRSGTTLLRLMLDAHPELTVPPETHFVPHAVKAARGAADPAEAFCSAAVGSERWGDFRIDEADLRSAVGALAPFDPAEAVRTFYRLYARQQGKPRYGDKTPGYVKHIALLAELLPEARFVHLIRDGRDVAVSVLALPWGPKDAAGAARWWRRGIRAARQQAKESGATYRELSYEKLITDPEATLRTLCEFIDLPYDPAMLDYPQRAEERLTEFSDLNKGKRVSTADFRRQQHQLTTEPPRTDRIERWRSELTAEQVQEFEGVAGGLLRRLGYETGS